MENIDSSQLPPFYVGQRVVALKDAGKGAGSITKGHEYPVLEVWQCKCGLWKVDIGLRDTYDGRRMLNQCSKCGVRTEVKTPIIYAVATLFAPIESQFQAITFKEVIAIESPITSMQ